MYRLTVVSGPGRGTVFRINEGENTLGRQLGNTVVLPSTQVSKRHCVLVASNGKVLVKDQGSANGTFVNGSLALNKQIKSGDRIGVGEYILELTAASPVLQSNNVALQSDNVVSLSSRLPVPSGAHLDAGVGLSAGMNDFAASTSSGQGPEAAPKDLIGKAFWAFENYVMPYFYGLNLKSEWRVICGVVFAGFVIVNLLVSVQPLLDGNTQVIMRESMRRASFMAKVIAEKNTPILASGNETRAEIGLPGHSDARDTSPDGILLAALTDLDLRIIAPAQRINQYLLSGQEAKLAKKAAHFYREGKEGGIQVVAGETVIAVEPVKVVHGGKNVVVAMAIVSLDVSTAVMGMGEVGLIYSQVLILTALVGMLALFIMYRMTLKPLQILGEDMDKALKGEITQVTHEFKCEELNPLWDLINSAIQRIPRGSSSELSAAAEQEASPEQFVAPIQATAEATGAAVAVCGPDRRVLFVSSAFERVTGIRADSAVGQEFSNLGTDQSTGAMVQELFDRVTPGGEAVTDDKEFSGVQYQLFAAGFGTPTDSAPRAYVLTVVSKGES
ncbi:MAG: FHA domain-containing protein [Bdellovibrionia bacterium]